MSEQAQNITKFLKPRRLLTPILIGLTVALLIFYTSFNANVFHDIDLNYHSALWLLMAIFMVVLRDLAYMVRIRILTDKKLNWKKSFQVIMLWEFSSAVIPPSMGGGFAIAIYLLCKEKIELGKSVAVILYSSLLDGIFLGVMAPLAYFTIGGESLFNNLNIEVPTWLNYFINENSIAYTFWIVYFVLILYKLVVAYALFINASAVKKLLVALFKLPLLKKYKMYAITTGDEMIIASKELKGKNLKYWFGSIASTFVSWTARFLIINFIIAAFNPSFYNHLSVYCKQVIIGTINIVSPTPGGSGLAEIMFSQFFKNELHDNLSLASVLAMLWRLLSYYPYLLIGAFIIPRWIKRVYTTETVSV